MPSAIKFILFFGIFSQGWDMEVFCRFMCREFACCNNDFTTRKFIEKVLQKLSWADWKYDYRLDVSLDRRSSQICS